MPGGDGLAAELPRDLEQASELHRGVAGHTGVGRTPFGIGTHEVPDHPIEGLRDVHDVERKAQPRGHDPGIPRVVEPAARGASSRPLRVGLYPGPQVYGDHLRPLLEETGGSHGAVHATGKSR